LKIIASFALLLPLAGCMTTAPKSAPVCYHRNEAAETSTGFCQAVRSGNTLHVSGITGQGEMPAAVRSVYERLKLTLEANGLSFANVVKENVYTTDIDSLVKAKDVRKEFYGQTFPAATWVQVQRLFSPAYVIEVELTAEYPAK
jgi:2-iminobutanoate/2-iminopropanoate deaminase